MLWLRHVGLALSLMAVAAGRLRAQVRLLGIAYDSLSGRPLAGATILLQGFPRTALTDSAGRFVLDSVPPGRYLIILTHRELDEIGLHSVVTEAALWGEEIKKASNLRSVMQQLPSLIVGPRVVRTPIVVRDVVLPASGDVHDTEAWEATNLRTSWASRYTRGNRSCPSVSRTSAQAAARCWYGRNSCGSRARVMRSDRGTRMDEQGLHTGGPVRCSVGWITHRLLTAHLILYARYAESSGGTGCAAARTRTGIGRLAANQVIPLPHGGAAQRQTARSLSPRRTLPRPP